MKRATVLGAGWLACALAASTLAAQETATVTETAEPIIVASAAPVVRPYNTGPIRRDCCNTCGQPKLPAMKWITVWETVEMEIPTKVWVEVEREVPVRTFRRVQRMVEVPTFRQARGQVDATNRRTVYADEEYDDFETHVKTVEVPIKRVVNARVPVTREFNVCRQQYKWVEDKDGGRKVRVPEAVFEKVKVTSYRIECKEVDAIETKKIEEQVPVRRLRRVAREIEEPAVKNEKRWMPAKEKRVLTRMEPEISYKKVVSREQVTQCVKQPVTRRKRVQVPEGFARCPSRCDRDEIAELYYARLEREQAAQERPAEADARERLARIRAALETGQADESLAGLDAVGLAQLLAEESERLIGEEAALELGAAATPAEAATEAALLDEAAARLTDQTAEENAAIDAAAE